MSSEYGVWALVTRQIKLLLADWANMWAGPSAAHAAQWWTHNERVKIHNHLGQFSSKDSYDPAKDSYESFVLAITESKKKFLAGTLPLTGYFQPSELWKDQ